MKIIGLFLFFKYKNTCKKHWIKTDKLTDHDWLQSIKECSHCSHNLSTAWFIQPLTNSHVINSSPIRLFAFSFSLRHRPFHPLFAVSYLFGSDNYQRHCLYLGAFNTYMEMEVPLIGMYSTENLTFCKNEGIVKLLSLTTLNHWWCWNIDLILWRGHSTHQFSKGFWS